MILELLPVRIKTMREAQKLSQYELAKLAKCTQAQISYFELGKQYPGLETTVRLAAAFGCSLADFLGERDPKCAPPREPSDTEKAIWLLEKLDISKVKLDQVRHILLPFRL